MWIVQANPLALSQALDIAEKLSGALIAFMFFLGLRWRWFVLAQEFEEMRSERDWWRNRWMEERARTDRHD